MSIKDHPNFKTIKTFVDSTIIDTKNRQAKYFSKRKRYFQGIKTPTLRCDGAILKDVNYGKKPADQLDSWFDFAPLSFHSSAKFPVRVQIDTYASPEGHGYKIRFDFHKEGLGPDSYGTDGDHWLYVHHEGPEDQSGIFDEWHIEIGEE